MKVECCTVSNIIRFPRIKNSVFQKKASNRNSGDYVMAYHKNGEVLCSFDGDFDMMLELARRIIRELEKRHKNGA